MNVQPSKPLSLEVKHLTKRYGAARAISGLNFSTRAGEVVGFLGPNGAGKTTTLKIIAGLMPASSGEVWINGYSVALEPEVTKGYIGYMPENNPLPEDLRVKEYLLYRAGLKGIRGKAKKERVKEVAQLCELDYKAQNKTIDKLSKGYKQRVGIADALLAKPELLILDEPTIGLDPHQIISIRELIKGIRGEVTVVFSSHILPEVEQVCDQVIIINQGEIITQGTSDALQAEFYPKQAYRLSWGGSYDAGKWVFEGHEESVKQVKEAGKVTEVWLEGVDVGMMQGVLKRLSEHPELEVRYFGAESPNLESIFIKATEPEWRKHG